VPLALNVFTLSEFNLSLTRPIRGEREQPQQEEKKEGTIMAISGKEIRRECKNRVQNFA
jgi:hypothetical protein